MTLHSAGRMRAAALGLLGVVLVSLQSDAAEPEAQPPWTIASQSLLYVKVFKASTIGSGLAHDHVIRATRWDARLDFDPTNPSLCRLALQVPVAQLVVDEPWLRKRVGFGKSIDAEDRQKVRRAMLDEDQLDAQKHTLIRVEGSRCVAAAGQPGRFDVQLAVSVRGRTKRLATRVTVNTQGNQMRISGGFRVRHADFGMKPYSAFLGAVANAEPIEFSATVLATR